MTSQQFVDVLDPTLYPVDGGGNGETGAVTSVQVDLFPPGCAGDGPGDPNGGDTFCGTDPLLPYLYSSPITDPNLELLANNTAPWCPTECANLANGSSAYASGTATEMLVTMLDGGLTADGVELDGGLVDAGLVIVPFYGFITIDQSTGGNGNDQAAAPLTSLQQVAGACPCPGGCGGDGGCSLDFTTQPSVLQIRIDPTHWFDGVDFSKLIPAPPTCGSGCDAGPGWSPDAGALTWNAVGPGADSYFNTALVEEGLQSANGVYLFNVAPKGSN